MGTPKARCCRSRPRCARCPVLIARHAAPQPGRPTGPLNALIAEVLHGAPRELPACVGEALAALERARESPRQRIAAGRR